MAAPIDEKERGTAKRGIGGEKKSVLERFKEDAVLAGILGVREGLAGLDFLNPVGARLSVQDARAEAKALQAKGNYDRAVEVATGFQEYFDIGREGKERGSSKTETAAVMLGHATGFNQAIETYKGEDRSSKELHGVDRFLRGVDAVLRLANTVSTVAGGVEAASSKMRPGLPFSSERAMNSAVAAEAQAAAQEAKAATAGTSTAMKALQPPPIIDEMKQAKALKPLEEELKAAARGTKGSITAAPKKVKNIERGLTIARPGRAKPSNTQKKEIVLDYSRERPIDPLDNELSMMERRIALERNRVGKIRLTAPKDWTSGRAGITKRLYNLLERRAALFRAKVWPDRRVLEQARLLGVIKDGKLVATHHISKSGKGRIADIATLSGDKASTKALLEDLKTPSTEVKSIKGGLKSAPVDAEFRSRSEIGKQHEVEDDVMKYAAKHGGKLVIEGNDVRTGKTERIEIDPANVSRQVTDYSALPSS
jgi:hypothetical protein